jgi:hypothetical protein
MDQLSEFSRVAFGADGTKRAVYRKGSGPPVIVMHEVPGISAEVLDDAVVAPVLARPSFPLPITPAKAAALHVTPEKLENARRRIRNERLKLMAGAVHRRRAVLPCSAI